MDQVGVLVFVHQDVAEAAVILCQYLWLLSQDLGHVQQQVAKVGGVKGRQPGLVGLVEGTGLAAGEIGVFGRGHALRGQCAILPALDDRHERLGGPALGVHPPRFHDLLKQAKLVVAVEDGEVGLQPDQVGVAP